MDQSSSEIERKREGSVEGLLADLIDRVKTGEEPDLDALCLRYPEHDEELRRRFEDWRRAGRVLERLGLETPEVEDAVAGGPSLPEPGAPPERSALYWSRYSVKEEIGRGGMGSILSVHDEDLGRELAMKVLRDKGRSRIIGEAPPVRPERQARFLEEARITGRLQHPNIVPVHELGVDPEGRPYFTMKLVEGRTLREIFKRLRQGEKGWNVQRALGVLLKVCEAVGFAHDKGIVHRDLKPSNLMVGSFGEVYVMDWGLARDLTRPNVAPGDPSASEPDHESPASGSRTRDGDVIGTPEYMAPEQALGDRDRVGPLSDVFAVGAMLYELLTGRTPYGIKGSDSPQARIAAALGGEPARVSSLAPDTSAELCAICEHAIARDPAERYPSMIALARDLRAYLEGRVVEAYATGAWAEFRKWIQRNPVVASLAGLLLIVLTAGLAAISTQAVRIQRANEDLALRTTELQESNTALEAKTAEARASEEAARRNADAEKRRSEEVLRLAISQDYEDLLQQSTELWPAYPDRIAPYEDWIARAEGLMAQIPDLRAKQEELRREAIPRTAEERRADRENHPEYGRLETLRAEIEAKVGEDAELTRLREELALLEAEVDRRRDWRFPEERAESRWWNNQLTTLIADLTSLEAAGVGLLTEEGVSEEHGWSIRRRLASAERLRDGFAPGGEFAERWARDLPEIRTVYPSLDLDVQRGLVPIGPDPASGWWEFWQVQSGEEPLRDEGGELILTEASGLVLVLLPGGTFWMGCQDEDPEGRNYDPQDRGNESPVHEVELMPFFLSKYEMSQGQWKRLAATNPSRDGPDGLHSAEWNAEGAPTNLLEPVEQVSWFGSTALLAKLGLSLPSEAQWEYGARGGTSTPWWSGNEESSLQDVTNLADLYAQAHGGNSWIAIQEWLDDGYTSHAPVHTLRANPFGLHHVHGNVWEWCRDGYGGNSYPSGFQQDPVYSPDDSNLRVSRGGGFTGAAVAARSSCRNAGSPTNTRSDLGLRPARSID